MNLDSKKSFLELKWLDPDELMDREAFKKEMIAYREAVLKHKTAFVLNNSLGGTFVMTPEIQEWISHDIYPYTSQYLKKIAFVMPWDLIQKLAMTQMIDEYEQEADQLTMQSRYFKSVDEATAWLFE